MTLKQDAPTRMCPWRNIWPWGILFYGHHARGGMEMWHRVACLPPPSTPRFPHG